MSDPTEAVRRELVAEINLVPGSREALEAEHGQVWSTDEMSEEFEAIGFMAPLIVVRRRSDGRKGSLFFQHSPRFYFNFQPHCQRQCGRGAVALLRLPILLRRHPLES